MKKINPINYKLLRPQVDLSHLNFKTTDEMNSFTHFVGQERALHAIQFGVNIESHGYNLYAMGPSGIGKRSFVQAILEAHAKKLPVPSDWCYIHNFAMPDKPIALQLPPGLGRVLQEDMKSFIHELGTSILAVFESDEYHSALMKINKYFSREKESNSKAEKTPSLYKKKHKREKKLQLKMVSIVLKPIFSKLKKKYKSFPSVIAYLNNIKQDVMENIADFIRQDEKTNLYTFTYENPVLTKYKVNLLVDNAELKCAPIIFEEAPSYSSLICRIEHTSEMGALVTNFTLIRAGDLHRANGGYLLVEARKLKANREAWEALKSALYSQEIRIKPLENEYDSIKPVSLEPMSIPLKIKVILLGDRKTYYSLCQHDPDFTELFKVAVDFDEQIKRNKKNTKLYAKLIATIVKQKKLRPFHISAVAAVIDYSSRLAEDVEKLSTHIRDIEDLLLESDYYAGVARKKMVKEAHIKQAIQAQIHRMDRTRQLYYEDILRNFIIIKTEGSAIGQANCLSVRRVGNFSYGHPTRVTARVRLGKGKLIDIQREIKMAGPIHSKAGLIIANFLASRFNQDLPFSLSVSLAFEQIYCWTDGDSASVGELCALLSALAEIPLLQSLAVSGSIDQYGEVQAIGGVNEKIEGFFDVCKARGLSGKQGVIIPAVNIKNLMLREDVVDAARLKKFFIYPIETIDDAISLLTGLPAGKREKRGNFPKDSVYFKIEERLKKYSKTRIKSRLIEK